MSQTNEMKVLQYFLHSAIIQQSQTEGGRGYSCNKINTKAIIILAITEIILKFFVQQRLTYAPDT